ncbi:MAG: amidohydrolase family protein, partial [Candidatus Hodarchaeota archaeon]
MRLLIKNGLIIDGTGSEAYKSDILIDRGIVQKIGNDLPTENCEIIDASNRVVCPGFIDMHSHGDFAIMHVNKAEATIMQGVTTLVVAMCGIGVAPANDKVRRYYDEFVAKTFGSGKMKLYDTIKEYMDAIEKKGISTNLAFFIPQGNVRASVLGTEDRKATEQEIDEMKRIVQGNMEAGAFGLSTGLVYPPGSITPTEEIIELCKVVKKYNGIYDSHMRNEGTGVIKEGMNEIIRVAKEAKVQAQISHWKAGSSF